MLVKAWLFFPNWGPLWRIILASDSTTVSAEISAVMHHSSNSAYAGPHPLSLYGLLLGDLQFLLNQCLIYLACNCVVLTINPCHLQSCMPQTISFIKVACWRSTCLATEIQSYLVLPLLSYAPLTYLLVQSSTGWLTTSDHPCYHSHWVPATLVSQSFALSLALCPRPHQWRCM